MENSRISKQAGAKCQGTVGKKVNQGYLKVIFGANGLEEVD